MQAGPGSQGARRTAALLTKKMPFMFTAVTRSKSASVVPRIVPTCPTPAMLATARGASTRGRRHVAHGRAGAGPTAGTGPTARKQPGAAAGALPRTN